MTNETPETHSAGSPAAPRIEIRENGPLFVHDLQRIKLPDGRDVETDAKFALCRCGRSANKPFCDGTHKRVGFSGARETTRPNDREESYRGRDHTVLYRSTVCAHVARCVSELPTAFRKGERPWVDPDAASTEEIARIVERCPSGALAYALGEQVHRGADRAPAIQIEKNGPYWVQGRIRLDSELQPPSAERYLLCRCGASKNKPYCDGSHTGLQFDP